MLCRSFSSTAALLLCGDIGAISFGTCILVFWGVNKHLDLLVTYVLALSLLPSMIASEHHLHSIWIVNLSEIKRDRPTDFLAPRWRQRVHHLC